MGTAARSRFLLKPLPAWKRNESNTKSKNHNRTTDCDEQHDPVTSGAKGIPHWVMDIKK